MLQRKLTYILLVLGISFLTACRPTIPSEYIQPDEMESILYDYHLAIALQERAGLTPTQQQAYKIALLEKHGVTEKAFENSLEYYTRHTEQLHKIYERISQRLENEARQQGLSESDFNTYGTITAKGDTADVWNKARTILLTPNAPSNHESFTIKADTAFHAGDQITLSVNATYLLQEGSNNGMMLTTITLSNDSTITQTRDMSSDGKWMITINTPDSLRIKTIRGYFLFQPDTYRSSTFKLLVISNIRLTRMHIQPTELVGDSLTTDPIRAVGGTPVNKTKDGQRQSQDAKNQQNDRQLKLQSQSEIEAEMRKRNIPHPSR